MLFGSLSAGKDRPSKRRGHGFRHGHAPPSGLEHRAAVNPAQCSKSADGPPALCPQERMYRTGRDAPCNGMFVRSDDELDPVECESTLEVVPADGDLVGIQDGSVLALRLCD